MMLSAHIKFNIILAGIAVPLIILSMDRSEIGVREGESVFLSEFQKRKDTKRKEFEEYIRTQVVI